MSNEKRTQILTVALETFFRHGFKRVSMQDIAEAAGLSRQGVYLHFKTKEDVFCAAVEQRAEGLLQEIHHGIARKRTAVEKMLYAFEVWTIRDFEKEVASQEAREIQDFTHAFMEQSFEKMRARFEAILAHVIADHHAGGKAISGLTPRELAHLIYASMRGLKLSAKSGVQLRKMLLSLIRICMPNERK